MPPDSYRTLGAPATGEFKDRGSKFLAFAWPAHNEEAALAHLEALRKAHLKARHHCYAWRFGLEGNRFRANDDGEPSGTAGRPILGQIDAAGLTDVVVVVVRYFGGVLLGASGLIHAYREAAASALQTASIEEKILFTPVMLQFDYAIMPDLVHAVKQLGLEILRQDFDARGRIEIAIRKNETADTLLQLKALLWKVRPQDAQTLEWPATLEISY
jgi:uncharacterized YigZ family protein